MDRRYLSPVLLGLMVASLWLAQAMGILPPTSDLAIVLADYLKGAGPWIIVLVATIENVVGINSYFPGAIPLLMVAATASSPSEIMWIVSLIFVGQIVGLTTSFGLGRLLRPRGASRKRFGKTTFLAFPLFAHPQSAAATAFLWGSTFRWTTLSVIASSCLIWSAFWGTFIYFGGSFVFREVGWDYITLAVCLGWLAWLFLGDMIWKRRAHDESARRPSA